MTRHVIEIERSSYGKGHYDSNAILKIKTPRERHFAPGGWSIGGWDKTAEGRVVDHGPLVPGPYAFVFGLAGVIDASRRGGTFGEHSRAKEAGRYFEVEDGDTLEIAGETYVMHAGSEHSEPTLVLEKS